MEGVRLLTAAVLACSCWIPLLANAQGKSEFLYLDDCIQ